MSRIAGEEILNTHETIFVIVEGHGQNTVRGIHRYHLWLDRRTYMPLKVVSYDAEGCKLEEILMDDLEINPEFPSDFFIL